MDLSKMQLHLMSLPRLILGFFCFHYFKISPNLKGQLPKFSYLQILPFPCNTRKRWTLSSEYPMVKQYVMLWFLWFLQQMTVFDIIYSKNQSCIFKDTSLTGQVWFGQEYKNSKNQDIIMVVTHMPMNFELQIETSAKHTLLYLNEYTKEQ